ncbi:hypothetical protein K7X08_028661 [Anisodus acutangulus]|uniref:Uncharacterized protein n=1 Tax=Anisodus acutangulus TaxID=402998 RepID=A0A9Q1LTA2_9SOLA|nr:hypothetical protein K7X08_028661 [Anisodus acutangulus]
MQQRRIARMRFLGELSNYELVGSSVIFDTLYLIIVFGHGTSELNELVNAGPKYGDKLIARKDLFAELCPNMMRYASIEEVNVALVDLEEHERIFTSEKDNNEKHSEIEKIPSRTTSIMSVNGKSLANDIEENRLHKEIMEIESNSESGTIEHVGHDDDEETNDWNRDDRGDTEDESDEEDKVHVRSKVAEVNPLEEKEFERELRAMMQEKVVDLEEKQDIKRLVLEYNDREEEKLNGLGNQLPSWTQNSGSRVAHRGNTWDAPGRGSVPRHCYLHHSGGGLYYGRRR